LFAAEQVRAGDNVVVVEGVDVAGNVGSGSAAFFADGAPPRVVAPAVVVIEDSAGRGTAALFDGATMSVTLAFDEPLIAAPVLSLVRGQVVVQTATGRAVGAGATVEFVDVDVDEGAVYQLQIDSAIDELLHEAAGVAVPLASPYESGIPVAVAGAPRCASPSPAQPCVDVDGDGFVARSAGCIAAAFDVNDDDARAAPVFVEVPGVIVVGAVDGAANAIDVDVAIDVDGAAPAAVAPAVVALSDRRGRSVGSVVNGGTVVVTTVFDEAPAAPPTFSLREGAAVVATTTGVVSGVIVVATFADVAVAGVSTLAVSLDDVIDDLGHAAVLVPVALAAPYEAGLPVAAAGAPPCPPLVAGGCVDADGDGVVAETTGCDAALYDFDDGDPRAGPTIPEIPGDGIDNDGVGGDAVVDDSTAVFVADTGEVFGTGSAASPFDAFNVDAVHAAAALAQATGRALAIRGRVPCDQFLESDRLIEAPIVIGIDGGFMFQCEVVATAAVGIDVNALDVAAYAADSSALRPPERRGGLRRRQRRLPRWQRRHGGGRRHRIRDRERHALRARQHRRAAGPRRGARRRERGAAAARALGRRRLGGALAAHLDLGPGGDRVDDVAAAPDRLDRRGHRRSRSGPGQRAVGRVRVSAAATLFAPGLATVCDFDGCVDDPAAFGLGNSRVAVPADLDGVHLVGAVSPAVGVVLNPFDLGAPPQAIADVDGACLTLPAAAGPDQP
jgi:hypothetical protein